MSTGGGFLPPLKGVGFRPKNAMSLRQITYNLQAGGNIAPKSIVKLDPANPFQCLQAGVGDVPLGISGNWTHFAPGVPGDDGLMASSGEFPEVNGMGSIVPLQCGTAWVTGNYLKADASGFGAPVTGSADLAIAQAFESNAAGEFGRVLVLSPTPGAGVTSLLTLGVNTTLTAAQSGSTIVPTTFDLTFTTPAGVAGMRYRVVVVTASAANGGSVGTTLHVPTGDTLAGNGFTAASGKGAVNTDGTAVAGNWIEILCTSANTWVIVGIGGTWARET